MGELVNVVRMTISVPKALKAKMDAEDGVNWSAVASAAFEAKLLELVSKKEATTMSDVVQRLRASKQRANDRRYGAGKEAGREWAANDAEALELENLAAFAERLERDPKVGWDALFVEGEVALSHPLAEFLYIGMHPEEEDRFDPEKARLFWLHAVGDDAGRLCAALRFLQGFVDGALGLWAEVKSQL
jgi:hypothetical protein